MGTQQGSRPADPSTTATTTHALRPTTPMTSTELYEAGFSTLGRHPFAGIAMAATIDEARQRLADMLLFADPTAPTTADIVAFHRAETVDHYHGTAGDIFAKVNTGTPGRTIIARPLTTTTSAAADAAVDGQR